MYMQMSRIVNGRAMTLRDDMKPDVKAKQQQHAAPATSAAAADSFQGTLETISERGDRATAHHKDITTP